MVYSGRFEDWLELRHFYQASPWFDGLVYLSVFTALVHLMLRKHFPHGGRPLVALSGVTGLALAVGAAHAADRAGFRLSDLGGFAWLVLGTTLFLVALDVLKNLPWPDRAHHPRDPPTQRDHSVRVPEPPSGDAAGSLDTAQKIEESIHSHLCEAYELVVRNRHFHRVKAILIEINRRERMVQRLYRHTLKHLARRRWMMSRGRRKLNPHLRELMLTATNNISDFERLMDVAQSAAATKNQVLLKGSIERMISLEEQSIQLAALIRAAMGTPQRAGAEIVTAQSDHL
jgi:hypothetical protein